MSFLCQESAEEGRSRPCRWCGAGCSLQAATGGADAEGGARGIGQLDGTFALMARLLYSSGLRHQECLRLRVMDIDFGRNEITVRQGNGDKDQRTMLPLSEKMEWEAHLRRFRHLHERDLSRGFGSVWLPKGLERKYPNASWEWCWQVGSSHRRSCRVTHVPGPSGGTMPTKAPSAGRSRRPLPHWADTARNKPHLPAQFYHPPAGSGL
jgi:hypothetical protein